MNPSNQQPLPGVTSWDASAVDGYTFAYSVLVKNDPDGTCSDQSATAVTEINGIAMTGLALAYRSYTDETKVVGCFSPCTLLTSGQWLGRSEQLGKLTPESDQAQLYCCPTGDGETWSVPPEQCSTTGKTINGVAIPAVVPGTNYVNTVHEVCNSYAYAYDDRIGAVNCAATVQYEVVFCPAGTGPELPVQRQAETFCNPQREELAPAVLTAPLRRRHAAPIRRCAAALQPAKTAMPLKGL